MPSEKSYERPTSFWKNILIPWVICLIAALFYLYDFILRVTPSIMTQPLMQTYGVNAAQIGLLSAFYYYIYTPLQLPSGVIVDKYSSRLVLGFSALICSLGALLFGFTHTLALAFVARVLMGFGSAFAFVGCLKLAALWLPRNQFALFSGIATTLGTLGAIFVDTIFSSTVASMGWRNTMYIIAAIGLVLTLAIFLVVRDKPEWVPKAPKDFGNWANVWKRILATLRNWHIWVTGLVGAFLFLPISVVASLWGVDFLNQAHGLSVTHAALATSLLFWGMAIGSPIVGWLSDAIKSRKIPLFLGTVLTFILLSTLIYTNNLPHWLIYILLFLTGFCVAPEVLVFAVAREVSPPRTTGISTATVNFIVTIGAAVFQPLIGFLLDENWDKTVSPQGTPIFSTHDYRIAFLGLVAVLIVAFILVWFMPKTECQMIHPAFKLPKFRKRQSQH